MSAAFKKELEKDVAGDTSGDFAKLLLALVQVESGPGHILVFKYKKYCTSNTFLRVRQTDWTHIKKNLNPTDKSSS